FFKNLFSLNSANPLQRKFLQLIIQSTLLHNIANNHLQEVCNMGERTEFRTGDKAPNNGVYIEFGETGSTCKIPNRLNFRREIPSLKRLNQNAYGKTNVIFPGSIHKYDNP